MVRIKEHRIVLVLLWIVATLAAAVYFFVNYIDIGDVQAPNESRYIRSDRKTSVIIFVHGLQGNSKDTWTNPTTKAFWPEMITKDPAFDSFNVYNYEYYSPSFGVSYSIDDLATNMHSIFVNADVFKHDELIFIMHSMGGLVTRKMILRFPEIAGKVRLLYFYSTPSEGSQLAQLGSLFSANPQFKDLFPMDANSFIEGLQSDWLARHLYIRTYCAFEKLPTNGIEVVTRQSATALCTDGAEPILGDHISIVKPASENEMSYISFRNAVLAANKNVEGPSGRSAAEGERPKDHANSTRDFVNEPNGETTSSRGMVDSHILRDHRVDRKKRRRGGR